MDPFIKRFECTDINGYHSAYNNYCMLVNNKDDVDVICQCAKSFCLDVSVEEIQASITVKFFKVIVSRNNTYF